VTHHPILHCLVSGGGLACTATASGGAVTLGCVPARVLLPVRVLSAVFRRHYLAGLRRCRADRLRLGGFRWAALAEATAFAAWLQPVAGVRLGGA